MRIARVRHQQLEYFGELCDSETVRLWTAAPWDGGQETDRLIPFRRSTLLPPVTPSKIICVGRNYRAHAEELGNEVPVRPLLFLKAPSSLIAAGETILLPPESTQVDHEAELAVVIAERTRRVTPEQALSRVFGYTSMNDVTARDIQRADIQFTRGKSFDTFCPCGPWIESDFDPSSVAISLDVNGDKRQSGNTDEMIHGVAELISFISQSMTLLPGDLVSTGSPAGVSPLADGDVVSVHIEGLGSLGNPVARELPR